MSVDSIHEVSGLSVGLLKKFQKGSWPGVHGVKVKEGGGDSGGGHAIIFLRGIIFYATKEDQRGPTPKAPKKTQRYPNSKEKQSKNKEKEKQ